MIPNALAPNTFLMPISFSLFSAVKAAKPKRPRQEMTIAKPAKYLDRVETYLSEVYRAC
jgi:hypothetical protein